jgi:hypothetical protein
MMMLLTFLISRKMIYGGNPSCAQVAGDGIEGGVVGARVGRCAWEAVYLVDFPISKTSSVRPPSCGVWLWRPTMIGKQLWRR